MQRTIVDMHTCENTVYISGDLRRPVVLVTPPGLGFEASFPGQELGVRRGGTVPRPRRGQLNACPRNKKLEAAWPGHACMGPAGVPLQRMRVSPVGQKGGVSHKGARSMTGT